MLTQRSGGWFIFSLCVFTLRVRTTKLCRYIRSIYVDHDDDDFVLQSLGMMCRNGFMVDKGFVYMYVLFCTRCRYVSCKGWLLYSCVLL